MGIPMTRNAMADQGRSTCSTGEKCPGRAQTSSGQASHTAPLCDLCALLRRHTNRPPSLRHIPAIAARGLRIALVDEDEGTHLAAREMVQAKRDAWTLEAYHPSCFLRDLSRLRNASIPSPAKEDHASRPSPDIVWLVWEAPTCPASLVCESLKGFHQASP